MNTADSSDGRGATPLTPSMERAIASLMAAMTRWEPLSPNQAKKRWDQSVARMGLGSLEDGPPIPCPPESAMETLSAATTELKRAPKPVRSLALQAALDVALASETLPLAQNLALRTLAEVLGLENDELGQLFKNRTGQEIPEPWDPSDPEAWEKRASPSAWDDAGPYPPPKPPPPANPESLRIKRIKALALLGLDEGATAEDIKRAFHRISMVHHPDHYAPLGDQATTDATRTFQRIRDAYDFLRDGPS